MNRVAIFGWRITEDIGLGQDDDDEDDSSASFSYSRSHDENRLSEFKNLSDKILLTSGRYVSLDCKLTVTRKGIQSRWKRKE